MGKERKMIFVVDDNITNLSVSKNILKEHYDVLTLNSGPSLFKAMEKKTPDLILLDIEMPEMDGFTVLGKLKDNEDTIDIPVIFCTAYEVDSAEEMGLSLGAVDYVTKPFSEAALLNRIAFHLHNEERNMASRKRLELMQNSMLSVIVDIVEKRDISAESRIERTSGYLLKILETMAEEGIYAREIALWDWDIVVASATLRDIGKIAVPEAVLMKTVSDLTDVEIKEYQKHTENGEKIIDRMILKTRNTPYLRHALRFAGYHHERWDGKGYPRGCSAQDIPLEARIIAVVDAFDRMFGEIDGKHTVSLERAEEVIRNNFGVAFDPLVVRAFNKMLPRLNLGNKDA